MAAISILGGEAGDLGEFNVTEGTIAIESTTIDTGAFSYRVNPTTTGTGSGRVDFASDADSTGIRFRFRFATKPSANDEQICLWETAIPAVVLQVRLDSDGHLNLYNGSDTLLESGTTVLNANQWYRLGLTLDHFGAADDGTELFIDGVSEYTNTSDLGSIGPRRFYLGKVTNKNGESVDYFYDNLIINDGFPAADPGAGQSIARSPITGGSPTHTDWSGGGNSGANWDETPTDGATTEQLSAGTDPAEESAIIAAFDATQSGHGSETIGASDTINGAKALVVANRTGGQARVMKLLERRNGSDTLTGDISGLLTTSYAVRADLAIFVDTLANLNGMEVGGRKEGAATGRDMGISTVWTMVDYTPSAAPAAVLAYRRRNRLQRM